MLVLIVWMGIRWVLPSVSKEKEQPKKESKAKAKKEDPKEQTSLAQDLANWAGMGRDAKKTKEKEPEAKEEPKPKEKEKSQAEDEEDFDFTRIPGFAYPKCVLDEQVVRHRTYTLGYNEDAEQANWVAYILTKKDVEGTASRKDDRFKEDLQVKSRSAQLEDYKNSGFDRGHLLPAADRKGSEADMAETFLLSNVSPQVHAMNSGIWEHAESQVRDWVRSYGKLYVTTGPCLKPLPTETIGPNAVAVPKYFYKVVLYADGKNSKMIGFWVPNRNVKEPLSAMVKPVKEIEKLTGIDFYPELPDKLERKLEAQADITTWP